MKTVFNKVRKNHKKKVKVGVNAIITKQVLNGKLRGDPTRTLTLRNKFMADMNRRFTALKKSIQDAIVMQDIFGLSSIDHSLGIANFNPYHDPATGRFTSGGGGKLESRIDTISVKTFGRGRVFDVDVYINPSSYQIRKLIAVLSREHSQEGFYDSGDHVRYFMHHKTKDVYAWDAMKATHENIMLHYGFRYRDGVTGYFNLKDGEIINTFKEKLIGNYNPYHDPGTGQFTDGGGSGSAGIDQHEDWALKHPFSVGKDTGNNVHNQLIKDNPEFMKYGQNIKKTQAMDDYVNYGYRATGDVLRTGKLSPDIPTPDNKEFFTMKRVNADIKEMDGHFANAPAIPRGTVLYSGVNSSKAAELLSLSPGTVIADKNFRSTTYRIDVAAHCAHSFSTGGKKENNIILRIVADGKLKGISGFNKQEGEILINRDEKFRIISKQILPSQTHKFGKMPLPKIKVDTIILTMERVS